MIFDDMARWYGDPTAPPPPQPPYYPPPGQRPLPPRPASTGDQGCPRCRAAHEPYHLIHRHLDEATGSLLARITRQEALIMSALSALTDAVAALETTVSSAVGELGASTPDVDVQAAADRVAQAQATLQGALTPSPVDSPTEAIEQLG